MTQTDCDKDIFDKIMGWGFLKTFEPFYKKNKEILLYLLFGGLTTVISLAIKYGLLFTVLDAKNGFQLQVAVVISWIGAVTFAYVTNRKFVFASKCPNVFKEMCSFFGARLATLLMEMVLMWFFVTLLKLDTHMWIVVWTIVIQILIIIGNYILSKLFVFKKRPDEK